MLPETELMALTKIKLAQFLQAELSKKNTTLSKLAKETRIPKTCLHSWQLGSSPRLNDKTMTYLELFINYLRLQ